MKDRTIAFVANFTGIFLFGVSMVVIGSILPLLKSRFGMGDMDAGGLFSILPVGLLIGSVSFGPIVDKLGYRWVLSVASFFLALGFFGIAHAGSIHWLRICVFLFGMGGGTVNGGTSALVSDLSEGKGKIMNLNWLGLFYGIGAFSMPVLLSVVKEIHYLRVIDVISMISLLLAVAFLLIGYPLAVKKEKISLQLIRVFIRNRLFMAICSYLFFQFVLICFFNRPSRRLSIIGRSLFLSVNWAFLRIRRSSRCLFQYWGLSVCVYSPAAC